MVISTVQVDSVYPAGTITLSDTVAGNTLIAFVHSNGDPAATTFSDDVNGAYTLLTKVFSSAGTNTGAFIAYSFDIAGGDTIGSVTAAANDTGFSLHEYSGLTTTDPIDLDIIASGLMNSASSGARFNTASVEIAQADELLVGGWGQETTVNGSIAPNDMTVRTEELGHIHVSCDRVVSSIDSYQFAGSSNLGGETGWSATFASFKGDVAAAAADTVTHTGDAFTQNSQPVTI